MLVPILPLVLLLFQTPAAGGEDLTELWKAALRARSGPRGTVMVMNETAGICGVRPRFPCFSVQQAALRSPRPPAPADLLARLPDALGRPPRAISGLTTGALLVPRPELEQLLATAGGGESFWRQFYARYPDSAGYVVLSNPVFDESGDQAVLLMDHAYGTLGAEGHLVLLKRNRAAGGEEAYWRVEQSWTLWIS